jgi:excisionase family DNA binding protein
MTPPYLNPDEVAAILRLGKSTVYRALECGELPGQKVCGRWRTLRSDLDERIHDDRAPSPRASDPMPRRRESRFAANVVELRARRSA